LMSVVISSIVVGQQFEEISFNVSLRWLGVIRFIEQNN
jgi:hypothetical protein